MRVQVRFVANNGYEIVLEVMPSMVAQIDYLKAMELLIDGQPIMRTPFQMHGTGLHTVCSLDSDSIDTIEY